jgi:imidazoleglycerol-phosphate dehydratase
MSTRSRIARVTRKTTETDIRLRLNLDGKGHSEIATGLAFFDHMLQLVARHGGFDIALSARGDLHVDQHHTVEDVGLVLGEGVQSALRDKRGILRTGYFLLPMDETLAAAAVDLGGRSYCVVKGRIAANRVGDFPTDLLEDFFQAFAQAARANVHLRILYGRSAHHQVEAVFKCFARALRFAVARDARLKKVLPSTKGLL